MSDKSEKDLAETPRFEPEILPPERSGAVYEFQGEEQTRWNGQSFQGIYFTKISSWRLIAFVSLVLLIAFSLLFLFASTLLFLAPIIFVVVAASLIAAKLRVWFRR